MLSRAGRGAEPRAQPMGWLAIRVTLIPVSERGSGVWSGGAGGWVLGGGPARLPVAGSTLDF